MGRETGFREFVTTAERVQALVVTGLGDQVLRQSVVTESMPWTVGVVRLLDSAYGVKDRYTTFMTMLAVKSGGTFLPAPLKGLFRLSEKLWLRPTTKPDSEGHSFSRGNCANVFDVVRGMIMCTSMDALNICLGLLAACDVDLWRGLQAERGISGQEEATAAQAAGIREELDVLRVKNRFKQPTASGWADVLIKCVPSDHRMCDVRCACVFISYMGRDMVIVLSLAECCLGVHIRVAVSRSRRIRTSTSARCSWCTQAC